MSLLSRATTKPFSLWVSATYPFAFIAGSSWAPRRRLASRIEVGKSDRNTRVVRYGVKRIWFVEEGEPVIKIEDGCVIGRISKAFAKNCLHLEDGVISSLDVPVMDHGQAFAYVYWPNGDQGITSQSYQKA